MREQDSRTWIAVVLALCIAAWAFQGTRGLWEPDEGRYTTVALNMLESGDYVVPRLDHEHPHYAKPPLTYWALALSFKLFGHNTWAARTPMTLAFIFTGLLIGVLSRRWCPAAPWLPVLIWATMLGSFVASNVICTDMILTLWETLAMTALVAALARAPGQRSPFVFLMWLGWALAMLTKGPPGLLPLGAAVAVLAIRRDTAALKSLFPLSGLALFVVLGCGWYLWLAASTPGLAGYFAGYELYGRIFSDVQDRNGQWYGALEIYLPILLFGFLPWSVPAILRVRARTGSVQKTSWDRWRADPDRMLLTAWILLPLLVFFVARSRMPLYLLPLHVPVAIVLGRALAPRWLAAPRKFAAFAFVWLLALVTIKGVAPHWAPERRDARRLAAQLAAQVDLGAIDEIVFVQTKPVYGLRLYLDKQIERVDLQPQTSAVEMTARWETLCQELGQNERRIFIVSHAHLRQMTVAAQACRPVQPIRLGRLDRFDVLTLDSRTGGGRVAAHVVNQSAPNPRRR